MPSPDQLYERLPAQAEQLREVLAKPEEALAKAEKACEQKAKLEAPRLEESLLHTKRFEDALAKLGRAA